MQFSSVLIDGDVAVECFYGGLDEWCNVKFFAVFFVLFSNFYHKMPRKQFTVDEEISKITADSFSEDDIISEDDGWSSSDIDNGDVDAAPGPCFSPLLAVLGLGMGVRGQNMASGRRGYCRGANCGRQRWTGRGRGGANTAATVDQPDFLWVPLLGPKVFASWINEFAEDVGHISVLNMTRAESIEFLSQFLTSFCHEIGG